MTFYISNLVSRPTFNKMIELQQRSQAHIFTKDEVDKIGNTVIYFAERVPVLSKTKLLKLIYFLEETAVKICARPFLNLDFEVWQSGPIAKNLFVDLSFTQQHLLRDYLGTYQDDEGRAYFAPKKAFDDGEFSDSELAVMNDVINQFGQLTAKELIKLTHHTQSPWTLTAKKHDVLNDLLAEKVIATDHIIDFSILLDDEEKPRYADHLEYLEMAKSLK